MEELKKRVTKARASWRKQKVAFKKAKGTDQEARRQKVLKGAETKLRKAEEALKAAHKENRKTIGEKITGTGKKVFSWTGLAVVTVVTVVGGWFAYDYLKTDPEDSVATDQV